MPADDPQAQVRASRQNYDLGALDESGVPPDPFALFQAWLEDALASPEIEANAMAVASVNPGAHPSLRMVLLRGYDERGFVFFTNYESRKGLELERNASAALLWYWGTLQRQIRIEGVVERIAAAESDDYFAQRPRGHRISAWASPQSHAVASRADLEARVAEAERRFESREVERPPHWGGYRVVPHTFEFWQGRRNRIHDRVHYQREAPTWKITRLAP